MKLRRSVLTLGALALSGLIGCKEANTSNTNPGPLPTGVKRAGLTSFSGTNACADLEQHLEDVAVAQMKSYLDSMSYYWARGPVLDAQPTASSEAAKGSANATGPNNYTTTNTQVAGVDEADFVKNDGTRAFVLSGRKLYTTLTWPASSLAISGKLEIEGYPSEMFLAENRVVVFSTVFDTAAKPSSEEEEEYSPHYYARPRTKATVINVSNLANPTVEREIYLAGYYANSRRIGDAVRVVSSTAMSFPPGVQTWARVEWNEQMDEEAYKQALAAKLAQLAIDNEKIIRDANLDFWLPETRVKQADGTVAVIPRDCSTFYKNVGSTQLGLLTVSTLNLANTSTVGQVNVVGQVGEVYASTNNLYVSNYHWYPRSEAGQTDSSYIHQFELSSPTQVTYVASGLIDGHILNQFSMDEASSGHLRVATTTRTLEEGGSWWWWGGGKTFNHVVVLEAQNGTLNVVGKSEPLAEDERIFSARFVGDKGYVVTFRQVDPLFTFDLSNPTQPRKVGELKIPGFSSYIHPLDANHLLTIGTYLPEPDAQGQVDRSLRTVQLAIFDVSNMASPTQAFTYNVGNSSAYSSAQWEHKAFNFFPAKKLLALPFVDWSANATTGTSYWDSFKSELRVVSVDAQTGFQAKGTLSMSDLFQTYSYSNWSYTYTPAVRRSIMADDFVYAISDAGIRVANIANLSAPLSTALFDAPK